MIELSLQQKQAFLFDLDGCIYHGNTVAKGARELISHLRKQNKKVRFITNNSSENAPIIKQKLSGMGIAVSSGEIMTTTDYIGCHIKEIYGLAKVKVVGSQILKNCIASHGHLVMEDITKEQSDLIVIGRDVTFTYEKLKMIANEVTNGATPIGTNPDVTHPGMNGEIVPETGSLLAAVESMVGKEVKSFGKPAPYLFEYGIASCHAEPRDCVMIGDNYSTDMVGAMQLGMSTVWLTGVTLTEKQSMMARPTRTFPDLQALFDWWVPGTARFLS